MTFKDQIFSAGFEDTITFSDKLYAITGIGYDYLDTIQAESLTSSGTIEDFPRSTSGVKPTGRPLL